MDFQMVMSCLDEIDKVAGGGLTSSTIRVKPKAPTAPRPATTSIKPPVVKPVAAKPPVGVGGVVKSPARVAGGAVMRARAALTAQRGVRAIASTPPPIKGIMPSRPTPPVGGADPVARSAVNLRKQRPIPNPGASAFRTRF